MSRKKYELENFNTKTLEYEKVVCECGKFLFKTFLSSYDDRGITEESFFCDCGAIYDWTYGNVAKRLDNGVDWLLKRAEEAQNSERNLVAVRRELKILKEEKDSYHEALKEILSIEKDDEFNPYAYMMLEIMDVTRQALKGAKK